jgi:hypothetical protein
VRFEMTTSAIGLLGLLLLATPARADAGDEAAGAAPASAPVGATEGLWSVSVSPAYAWDTVPVFGGARDEPRSMLALDLRVHRRIHEGRNLLLDYTVGVVPVELEGGTVVSDPVLGARKKTVYGAGVDPVGFFLTYGRGSCRPFASFRGGIRVFADSVPNPRGTRFDFTADISVGLAQRVGSRTWLTAGPEFHHISNGGLGEFNPSLNYVAVRVGVLVLAR